jgi:predicted metal-dependent hydrolase
MSSRHPRANRECRLGDQLLAYEFQRAARRTIGLSVGPQGLSVRAPHWTPLAEVDALVLRKADWVLAKLRQLEQASRLAPAPTEWREGSVLPCLGRSLVLELCPDPGPGPGLCRDGLDAALADGCLRLALARDAGPERVRALAQAWLMHAAQQVFLERLEHFAPRLGVRYRSLKLSSATTRWGSASADGSLRLNWRLLHLELELIDYVVVHELSHLRQMNHGPEFWRVVASVMPDYEPRRQRLRRVRLAP